MQNAPKQKKRYDDYEPQKYNCISVNDDDLENIVVHFSNIDFFWHTLDAPAKGIAYTGITLIPPTSIQAFIDVIRDVFGLSELKELSEKALEENKWMIHFGI